jgi:Ca-activated chloride channel family protein
MAEITLRFANPHWLAAGLGICAALLLVWWRHDAVNRRALERFIAVRLRPALIRSVSPWRRRVQRALLLGAFAALCAALAGPQWGYRWEQLTSRGNDVVVALDTSRSMLTPDVTPNRLIRAKLAIDDLAAHLDGDAVGLVAFAGSAFLVNPITLDYAAFHESLAATDTETIPRGGTDIAAAIQAAVAALRQRSGGARILILLSDGENLDGDALAAARDAAREGLRIYTVGVGTPAGAVIPLPGALGGGFVKDEKGAVVTSRLDEPTLEAIAAASGGFYVPLGSQGEGLERIARTVIDPLAKHNLASRQQRIYIERFQWPLGAATVLLLLSLMVGTRRSSAGGRRERASAPVLRRSGERREPASAATAAATVAVTATAARNAAATLAALAVVAAASLRAAGSEAAASSEAAAPAKPPDAEFDSGAADYRAGRYSQAAEAFKQSITVAGNTLYRAGQKTEHSSAAETLKQWTAAVTAYDTALQLRPDDADSKYNRDYVQRKIDALRPPQDLPKNSPGTGGGGQVAGGAGSGPGGAGKSPPPPQAPQGPPPTGSGSAPPAAPKGGPPPPAGAAPAPGTAAMMSPEEARELLDSAKGDERRSLGAPLAGAPAGQPPDKPYKNW